jgi:hypothetical protein
MNRIYSILLAILFLFVAGIAETGVAQVPVLNQMYIAELLRGDLVQLPVLGASTAIACSANGADVLDAIWYGRVYLSHDYGLSWAATGPISNASDLAMSADGRKLVIAAGSLYQSNNGGVTWTQNRFNGLSGEIPSCSSVKSSADGSILMGLSQFEIVVSTNSGATWSWSLPFYFSGVIAMSGDGKVMVAMSYEGDIRISRDFGATWTNTAAPQIEWSTVTVSGDGSTIIAAASIWDFSGTNTVADTLYTSSDGGETWNPIATLPIGWGSIVCSADGSTIVAEPVYNWVAPIYVSHDGGNSWTAQNISRPGWYAVACSSDGGIMYAGDMYGGTYLCFLQQPSRLPPSILAFAPH